MGTKTLSIRDETYELLKSAKMEGESFSDVIDRLFKKRKENMSAYLDASKYENFGGHGRGFQKNKEAFEVKSMIIVETSILIDFFRGSREDKKIHRR